MAEHSMFEKYIKTTYNFEFKEVSNSKYKSNICKMFEEWKQTLVVIFSSLPYKILVTSNYGKVLKATTIFILLFIILIINGEKRIIGFTKFYSPHTVFNHNQSIMVLRILQQLNI